MQALIEVAGMEVQEAACEVASVLGSNTSKSVETIRLGYYNFRRMLEGEGAEVFSGEFGLLLSGFFARRDWVLSSNQDTLDFAFERYRKKFGKIRADKLAELFKEMRKDPTQIKAHRAWLEEQVSGLRKRLEAGSDAGLEFRVADLGECARLQCRLNRNAEALVLFRQAIFLCQAPGAVFPRQDKVIEAIQSEINRISGGEPSKAPNGNHG
jgi:hypothetical protein